MSNGRALAESPSCGLPWASRNENDFTITSHTNLLLLFLLLLTHGLEDAGIRGVRLSESSFHARMKINIEIDLSADEIPHATELFAILHKISSSIRPKNTKRLFMDLLTKLEE